MRKPLIALVLGIALITGACGTSAAHPEVPEPEPTSQPDDPDYDTDWPPMVVDWYGDFEIELPNGWTVRHCDGDAPLICFLDGDRYVGLVELGDYPMPDDYDGDARSYLYNHVESFLDGMRDDRAIGCPGLTFEATPIIDFNLGGTRGVKAGFRLVNDDGREVERHVQYWAVHDDAHFVITAAAYDDDGCLERLGEFQTHDLGLVTLYLDHIVDQTPLPAPTGTPTDGHVIDGSFFARISGMDAPVRVMTVDPVEVLTGDEAVAAAREDGEIGPDDDLPNDVYIRNLDGTTHSVAVSADAVVSVYDCATGCELVGVELADFLTGRARPFNGDYAIFDITISDGVVVEISEIYLP
jgi:hypothetical protein